MYFLLTEEEINGDALIRLVKKNDEDEIFVKLGLQTFGKRVKFRKLVEGLLPCHEKISRPATPSSNREIPYDLFLCTVVGLKLLYMVGFPAIPCLFIDFSWEYSWSSHRVELYQLVKELWQINC